MTVLAVTLQPNVWTDVYAATGILVGTELVLCAYSDDIDVQDSASMPALTATGYPLGRARIAPTTTLAPASLGCWAKPVSEYHVAELVVQPVS